MLRTSQGNARTTGHVRSTGSTARRMPALRARPPEQPVRGCPCGGGCPGCGPAQPGLPPQVEAVLREPGAPLPPALRRTLERRFREPLAAVRIHAGGLAAASARALGARAWTSGSAIAFGPGEYRPETAAGLRLLGHEVAHALQAGGRRPRPALGAEDRLEDEARAAGRAIADGASPPRLSADPAPALRRERHTGLTAGLAAVETMEADAGWYDPAAVAARILGELAGIDLADRDNLGPLVAVLRQGFPPAVAAEVIGQANAALVRRRQPSSAGIAAQQEAVRQLMGVRRRPGIVAPLLGDPAVLERAAELPLLAADRAVAGGTGFLVGLQRGFASVAQPHDAATLARLIATAGAAPLLSPAFVLGVSVGFYRHLPEDVRALAHLPELPAALDQLVGLVLSPEGDEAAEALGASVGAESAREVRRLLRRDPVGLAFGVGQLAGPLVVQTLLGLVGVAGVVTAARMLRLGERLAPLLARAPRLQRAVEALAMRLPRGMPEAPAGAGATMTARPPGTPPPATLLPGTLPAATLPAIPPGAAAAEAAASVADGAMAQRLAPILRHPLLERAAIVAEEVGGTLPDGPARARLIDRRRRLIEALMQSFADETGIPFRYAADFDEFVSPRVTTARRTRGVNIRRVVQPQGGYRVEMLVEPGLRDDPGTLLAELRHDLNSFYARGAGAEVPRGMPLLAGLPGNVRLRIDGQVREIPASRHWHAGRILDLAADRGISVDQAIQLIRANPSGP